MKSVTACVWERVCELCVSVYTHWLVGTFAALLNPIVSSARSRPAEREDVDMIVTIKL